MTPPQKKWILIAGICCCLAGLVFLIKPIMFLPIGGPVPMKIRTQSYLHTDDVIFDDGLQRTVFRKTGSLMNGIPPIFPGLSPYTSSVFHTREGSDDLYLTVVWLFTDRDRFLNQQGVLNSFYLERYGNLSTATLTFEYNEEPGNSANRQHRTNTFNVTGFENNITSGYFTTIQYPESKKPDFYIVYYGTVRSGNLSRQTPYLKKLMDRFFYPDSPGRTIIPVWTPSPDVTAMVPGVSVENASAITLSKFSKSINKSQPTSEFLEYKKAPAITQDQKDQCLRLIMKSKGFEKYRHISHGPLNVGWAYPSTGKLRISMVVGSDTSDIYGLYYTNVDPESDSIQDEGFVDWTKYW
jgi:hypothetical protein